mmetsp:Transcript_11003/g.9351  ORF Transcript_11003/g.9351 Transcript_11003/m.9351 type:complete len:127 (-) Transcript_11003:27-407(-)
MAEERSWEDSVMFDAGKCEVFVGTVELRIYGEGAWAKCDPLEDFKDVNPIILKYSIHHCLSCVPGSGRLLERWVTSWGSLQGCKLRHGRSTNAECRRQARVYRVFQETWVYPWAFTGLRERSCLRP